MRIAKDDTPVKLDVPGAKARQTPDFGTANAVLSAEYVIEGEIVVTYADGSDETCHGGDLYYWPASHTVRVVADAELAMFSPQAEHGHVIEHLAAKIAAMEG